MKKLSEDEIRQVNGGAILGAIAIGLAIGAAAKSAYNKYQNYAAEKAAAAQDAAVACSKDPSCI